MRKHAHGILLHAALQFALLIGACGYALAADRAYRISLDPGGVVFSFIDKYNAIRQTGGKVEIDGVCISACTLVAGLVPAENVCATPQSVMGFHSASIDSPMGRTFSVSGTRLMWAIYPQALRDRLRTLGWNPEKDHPDLIFIPATDLFRNCEP